MAISNFNKLVANPTYKLESISANYTINSADAGSMFLVTNGPTITIDDSVAIGTGITIVQNDDSPVRIQPGTGVTIYVETSATTGNAITSSSYITTRQKYSKIELVKIAEDTWVSSAFGIFVQSAQPSNPQIGDLWVW
jgi:hypothetical protein